jgi:hypothetical protein
MIHGIFAQLLALNLGLAFFLVLIELVVTALVAGVHV